jgi:hypothetical protein
MSVCVMKDQELKLREKTQKDQGYQLQDLEHHVVTSVY